MSYGYDIFVDTRSIWIKTGPIVAVILSVHPSKRADFVLLLVLAKNDESCISIILSNGNDTSSRRAVACSIAYMINCNLRAWCPSILQSNANRPCVRCVVFSAFPCFHFLTIFHRIWMDLRRYWWLQIIIRCPIRSENPSIIDSLVDIWPSNGQKTSFCCYCEHRFTRCYYLRLAQAVRIKHQLERRWIHQIQYVLK